MKKKNTELDVDFIGGQAALTPQEEKALSEYFAKKKQVAQKRGRTRVANPSKTTA